MIFYIKFIIILIIKSNNIFIQNKKNHNYSKYYI